MLGRLTALFLFLLCPLHAEALHEVNAVLFFSPDCTHCHEVIDNTLHPLLEEYPHHLEFVLVNVASHEGATLFYAVVDKWEIPEKEQGVPTLVIGDHLLIGDDEIPQKLPELVKEGIEGGGIALPAIPGLAEAIASAQVTHQLRHGDDVELVLVEEKEDLGLIPPLSVRDKLNSDPLGSALAIAMLVVMILSLGVLCRAWMVDGFPQGRAKGYTHLIPLLALAGLGISLYLGVIEMTGEDAICGYVGNCNAVQQSEYAWIFGLAPVGLVGAIGYLLIIAFWWWRLAAISGPATWLLPSVSFLGVIFTTYLTFLEPFVIGAICMWCLASSVLITAILWLTHPATSSISSSKTE